MKTELSGNIHDFTSNVINTIDKELARKNNQNLCETCVHCSAYEECDILQGYWNDELEYRKRGLYHHVVMVECSEYKREKGATNDKDKTEA
jgi:hypothetical protein